MRSHADENGVLHVTQCSHLLLDDDDKDEDEEPFAVVEEDVVVDVAEADSVEGDSSPTETLSRKCSVLRVIYKDWRKRRPQVP